MREYQKEYEAYMKIVTDAFINMQTETISMDNNKSRMKIIEWGGGLEYELIDSVEVFRDGNLVEERRAYNSEIAKKYLGANAISYDEWFEKYTSTTADCGGGKEFADDDVKKFAEKLFDAVNKVTAGHMNELREVSEEKLKAFNKWVQFQEEELKKAANKLKKSFLDDANEDKRYTKSDMLKFAQMMMTNVLSTKDENGLSEITGVNLTKIAAELNKYKDSKDFNNL